MPLAEPHLVRSGTEVSPGHMLNLHNTMLRGEGNSSGRVLQRGQQKDNAHYHNLKSRSAPMMPCHTLVRKSRDVRGAMKPKAANKTSVLLNAALDSNPEKLATDSIPRPIGIAKSAATHAASIRSKTPGLSS